MGDKGKFLYKIIFVIYFLFDIYLIKFIIWTSNLYKTLFYIRFILLSIYGIYSIMYLFLAERFNINFLVNHKYFYTYGHWIFSKAHFIIGLLFCSSRIINSFNEINYNKYIINCPFTFNSNITTFNESIYGKRRCELYNINLNSRYKYQYICTYNASEDFIKDKTKDGFDKILCISKINNIEQNDIIKKFNKVFENRDNKTDFFYCSRTDEPKKNEYIKDEYCNKENNNFYYSLIQWLFFLYDLINLFHTELNSDLAQEIGNRTNNMINGFRQQLDRYFGDEDTECDDSNSNNVSFNEEEDENIIIEDHTVYNVDTNIKDCIENNEKEKID